MDNGLKSYSSLHNHETSMRKRLALTNLNGLSARFKNYVVELVVWKKKLFLLRDR